MSYASLSRNRDWLRVEPVSGGWSGEEKYHIFARDGQEYLLRIADEPCSAMRLGFDALVQLQQENRAPRARYECAAHLRSQPAPATPSASGLIFDALAPLADLPLPRPIECGKLPGKVYALFSWLPGEILEDRLSSLDRRRQYALGVRAGRVLRQIHKIPAAPDCEAWQAHFNRKLDRKLKLYRDCALRYADDAPFIACVQENRALLNDRPQCFQHGDYHVGNMLLSPAGTLGVIDLNRADQGDPWEEFNRIVWSVAASPAFASGQVYGYFNGAVPEPFWRLLSLYISSNTLGSLPWAIPFGEGEIQTMRAQARDVLNWYSRFQTITPSWFYKPDFPVARSDLRCAVRPLGSQESYMFVVILSRYQGKWLLSRHRRRDTWETQGGHIEPGETPLQAARRELYEESGARWRTLRPVFDYIGWNDFDASAGVVFFAEIESLETIPDSEMAETRVFDRLPANLTYPHATPRLFEYLVQNILE